MTATATYQHIDLVFRQSYGQIVSSLIGRYGFNDLGKIENAAMEAFYKALKAWPMNGVPENPKGWLYTVSQRHLIDSFRKTSKALELSAQLPDHQTVETEIHEEIKDPELRLLFVICHPDLNQEDQLAFMLKLISGFGIREIAGALLQTEETIKKRLARARKFIKERNLRFSWPESPEIKQRRKLVHMALYLLFNEGYYSSHPERWIKKDFCLEAMRLSKFLCDHPLADPDTNALMSLMCYHISRFQSRTDEAENLILLQDQDRSKWDPYFITLGHRYLEKSARMTTDKTALQLEAFISAQHCMAPSLEKTNWQILDLLYTRLHQIKQNDLVLLNLIIVKMQSGNLQEAKDLYEMFDQGKMKRYRSTYFLVGAEIYRQMSDSYRSKMWLEKALKNSKNKKETAFLISRYQVAKNDN